MEARLTAPAATRMSDHGVANELSGLQPSRRRSPPPPPTTNLLSPLCSTISGDNDNMYPPCSRNVADRYLPCSLHFHKPKWHLHHHRWFCNSPAMIQTFVHEPPSSQDTQQKWLPPSVQQERKRIQRVRLVASISRSPPVREHNGPRSKCRRSVRGVAARFCK